MNLLRQIAPSHATTAGAVGAARTCAAVDMAGYEGLLVLAAIEDTVNSTAGTFSIRLQGNSAATTAATAFVNYTTGSGYIVETTTATTVMDDMLVCLDVSKFPDRYVRAVLDGSSTNSLGSVIYIRYKQRKSLSSPSTAADNVYAYAVLTGPTTA